MPPHMCTYTCVCALVGTHGNTPTIRCIHDIYTGGGGGRAERQKGQAAAVELNTLQNNLMRSLRIAFLIDVVSKATD